MDEVNLAFAAAGHIGDRVILLGIEPEGPDEEYGWIEPGTGTPWKWDPWGLERPALLGKTIV